MANNFCKGMSGARQAWRCQAGLWRLQPNILSSHLDSATPLTQSSDASCALPSTRNWRSYSTATANNPEPTPLELLIRDTIRSTGPISVAQYMQLCLSHPVHGYYMRTNNPVFGTQGDFITSPEISQVFGELLALWYVLQWNAAGRPRNVKVVELGPGRGTLMADMLRTWKQFPLFFSTLREIHLVETSEGMQGFQNATLTPLLDNAKNGGAQEISLQWHNSIDGVSNEGGEGPVHTIVVAHEFFDALPVHLLEKSERGWHEVLVSLDSTAEQQSTSTSASTPPNIIPALRLARSSSQTPSSNLLSLSSPRFSSLPNGSRIEVSPASFKVAHKIGELLGSSGDGGSSLIVDYGGDKAFGGSLRAFKNHQIVDIFHRPGMCDLTANVDFAYLKEAVKDSATTHGPISQRSFLLGMGITERIKALVSKAKDDRKDSIRKAGNRLIDLTGMGAQYKVMGLTKGVGEVAKEVWPFLSETVIKSQL